MLLLLWGLKITVESHWKDPANDLTFIVFMPMLCFLYMYLLELWAESAFIVCVLYFNSLMEIIHEI